MVVFVFCRGLSDSNAILSTISDRVLFGTEFRERFLDMVASVADIIKKQIECFDVESELLRACFDKFLVANLAKPFPLQFVTAKM